MIIGIIGSRYLIWDTPNRLEIEYRPRTRIKGLYFLENLKIPYIPKQWKKSKNAMAISWIILKVSK